MRSAFLIPALLSFAPFAFADFAPCEMARQLRLQVGVTESNISNVSTTRVPGSGPYRAKDLRCGAAGCQLTERKTTKIIYEPDHPDAADDGYVAYPDIDLLREINQMLILERALVRAQASCPKRS